MKKYALFFFPEFMLTPHIFRAYDVRGIYEKDFDEEGAQKIGMAYGTYLKRSQSEDLNLRIVVGRDGRTSGESLQEAFMAGVLSTGIQVTNIGMVTSPLLYFAICEGEYDGGVMITASHNPSEYNGFKLQREKAHAICGDEIQQILSLIEKNDFEIADNFGEIQGKNFQEAYFEKLTSLISFRDKKRPTIVIDAGNGITGAYAPHFFKKIGCTVHELFCEVDGDFPNHDADPEREENLTDLKKQVQEMEADFGIAFDGDGDRVGIVDSEGTHYSADLLLLLLSRDLLSRHPGAAIVYDLKSTEVLTEVIRDCGGRPLICQTGHSFVEALMEKEGALLGGEVSGHIFIGEEYYGYDDALLAAAKLITTVWNSGMQMKEHFSSLPKTYITPEIKVHISEEKKFEVLERIVETFLLEYPDALTIDGIRIDFGHGAWGIIRASNTSPYLTTRFEARSELKLREIQKIIFHHLREYPEISDIPNL